MHYWCVIGFCLSACWRLQVPIVLGERSNPPSSTPDPYCFRGSALHVSEMPAAAMCPMVGEGGVVKARNGPRRERGGDRDSREGRAAWCSVYCCYPMVGERGGGKPGKEQPERREGRRQRLMEGGGGGGDSRDAIGPLAVFRTTAGRAESSNMEKQRRITHHRKYFGTILTTRPALILFCFRSPEHRLVIGCFR